MTLQQQLQSIVLSTMDRVGGYECAEGWLRYEKMRTLNIQQLAQMQRRNLEGERWDDMIDRLLVNDIAT
jgi:hypothetical protein